MLILVPRTRREWLSAKVFLMTFCESALFLNHQGSRAVEKKRSESVPSIKDAALQWFILSSWSEMKLEKFSFTAACYFYPL